MAIRQAKAEWNGDLKGGHGSVTSGSGAVKGTYSFSSRFESGTGTNPEELIAAAHAGCFSMALANKLSQSGASPKAIRTDARVHLDKTASGFAITKIELHTEGDVPGLDEAAFRHAAEDAKANCPVSKALSAVPIELTEARLVAGVGGSR